MPPNRSRVWRWSLSLLVPLSTAASASSASSQPEPAPAAAPAGPVSQTIWPGIVRWYPSAEAMAGAPPSLIVQIPSSRFGPGPEHARITPEFAVADGRVSARIAIEPGTSLYGAGAVPGPLLLNGRTFVSAPADRDLKPPATDAASLALPWIVAIRPDGTAFGVMADTTWRTEIDLTDGITLRADGPTLPVIVVDADTPMSPPAAFSQIAGWQEIPPRWALGPQIGAAPVGPGAGMPRDMARAWRDHGLAGDVLWVYGGAFLPMGAKVDAEAITAPGWRTGVVLDPGLPLPLDPQVLASPSSNPFFAEGVAGAHWLRLDDSIYLHPFDPVGSLAFPDLTREPTRNWWSGLYRLTLASPFTAIDHLHVPYTNVPDTLNHAIPDRARHTPDPELTAAGAGTGSSGGEPHARFRSLYGSLLARAARDAAKTAFPDKRPLILTATPSLVSQRYAYLMVRTPPGISGVAGAIPTILNASLSGQVVIGVDIPGGDIYGDGSDLARDIALGSMLPMVRVSNLWQSARTIEPWRFSADVQRTCREALERRARLAPYLYSLTLDGYRFGFPMVRPLFFADPSNPALRNVTDAFLLGDNLLVRLGWPHAEPGPESILPGWRKFDFGEKSPLLPELYIRPGSIIPVAPGALHDGEKPLDPLTLVVCLNQQGEAIGSVYEDAGDGYAYTRNEARVGYYTATLIDGEITVKLSRLDGGMGMAKRKVAIRVLLPDGREAATEYWDGLDAKLKLP